MTIPPLSLIVTNVRVRTGNPGRPWATALGIRDGKLAVVGAAAEILKMAGTETNLVDAHGQFLDLSAGIGAGADVVVIITTDGAVSLRAGIA